jgi:hypothetical protein
MNCCSCWAAKSSTTRKSSTTSQIDLVYLKKFIDAYEKAYHNSINENTCDLTGNVAQAAGASARITTEEFLSDKAKPN